MAKNACKCKPTACEECPEWIFTFADLVMLMMGFFVILWVLKPSGSPKKDDAVAQEADERWLHVVSEIRGAFGWEPNPQSDDPIDKKIIRERQRLGEGKGGETTKAPRGAEGTDREVQSIRPGKHAVVGTRILFKANSAELDGEATRLLDEVVKTIRGHRQIFLVKGHASQDDGIELAKDPVELARLRMQISVRRAQAAADYLAAHGVEPEILRVEGCSIFEPVAQRAYTDDLRVLNRRVEVEGTDTPLSERQDGNSQTSRELPPGLRPEIATTPTESLDAH
jgi:outer membrane protein OmpA-like peptidoglycan-associated protein